MKYVVFGKKIKHVWNVKEFKSTVKNHEDGLTVEIYNAPPKLEHIVKVVETPEILRFEGEMGYNSDGRLFGGYIEKFNIDKDTEVIVNKKIFRADLGEYHIFTDHVLGVEGDATDTDPDYDANRRYETAKRDFNAAIIRNNKQLSDYCMALNLNPNDIDAIKLFEHLHPDKAWKIKDGKLLAIVFDCVEPIIQPHLFSKI